MWKAELSCHLQKCLVPSLKTKLILFELFGLLLGFKLGLWMVRCMVFFVKWWKD